MNKLVVKDNSLIDASFNLSLVEHRIMLLAIVEARDVFNLTCETALEIKAVTYKEQFTVDDSEVYQQLKDAGKTLKRREFTYLDKYKGIEAYSTVNWVNKITYVPKKGMIVLKLSADVIDMITRLETHFTKYYLNQVSNFKSKYALRLYELLMKWSANGLTQKYEIQDLRKKLGILDNEYKSTAYLKRDVLEKSIQEINLKTDLKVSYEHFKQGRSISHIRFKIATDKQKQIDKPLIQLSPKQIDMFSDKLSNLQSFQNHYQADVGASREQYKQQIAVKLQDHFYVDAWQSFLSEVGYR